MNPHRLLLLSAGLILSAATASAQPPSISGPMLQAHNAIRRRLSLSPLTWSTNLAALAQHWADSLIARRQFVHRPNSSYGENLLEIDGSTSSPAAVVEQWASEARNYDYRSNRCNGVCGHYTQIVWRDTREVGCGVARNARREVWVCDYNPPGNWIGKRPY